MPEDNGGSRLDRLERVAEKHSEQIAMLLEHGKEVNQFLHKIAEAHLKLMREEFHERLKRLEGGSAQ